MTKNAQQILLPLECIYTKSLRVRVYTDFVYILYIRGRGVQIRCSIYPIGGGGNLNQEVAMAMDHLQISLRLRIRLNHNPTIDMINYLK